jgi:hypothetical protein
MIARNMSRTSKFRVTSSLTKTTLYGLRSCIMTGTDTASDEAHKKRVTGGILRISSQNPVYDIVASRTSEQEMSSKV